MMYTMWAVYDQTNNAYLASAGSPNERVGATFTRLPERIKLFVSERTAKSQMSRAARSGRAWVDVEPVEVGRLTIEPASVSLPHDVRV